MVLSLWYSDSMLNILFSLSKMRKGNKERKKFLILAGKIKNEKDERNENENYYLLWWSDKKWYFLYNCLGLSDSVSWTQSRGLSLSDSVSWTDNFMTVFNSVTSPRVFSYCCVLHYFLTLPVVFNFNSTYGLKPQVSGIKIDTVYKRSIFQAEWLIGSLIHFLNHKKAALE